MFKLFGWALVVYSVLGQRLIEPNFSLVEPIDLNLVEPIDLNQSSTQESGLPRVVQELIQIQKESPNGIIEVDEKFAWQYLLKPKRPYTIILIATAEASVCSYCSEFQKYMQSAGSHLMTLAGSPLRDEFQHHVFIAMLKATQHRELAKLLGIQEVPSVQLLNHRTLHCFDADNHEVTTQFEKCRVEDQSVFAFRTAIQGTKELVEMWLKGIGRDDILEQARKTTYYRRLFYLGTSVLVLGSIGLYFFEHIRDYIVQRRQIIAFFALSMFLISTSGIIYNLQHNMEILGYNWKTQQSIWIAPQARSQYVAEGLIYSAICVVGSLCFYFGTMLPRMLAKSRFASVLGKRHMLINIFVMLLMMVGIVTYKLTRYGISVKRLGTRPSFFPEGMVKGSVRRDRMFAF